MNKDNTDFKSWFEALAAKVYELKGGSEDNEIEPLKYSAEIVQAFDDGKTVDQYAKEITGKK